MKVNRDDMRTWLASYLAQLLGMPESDVDASKSFEAYGLDSTAGAGLSADLEQLLSTPVPGDLAYECPSINAVLGYLSERGLLEEPAAEVARVPA
jgi:acyl carrier protein